MINIKKSMNTRRGAVNALPKIDETRNKFIGSILDVSRIQLFTILTAIGSITTPAIAQEVTNGSCQIADIISHGEKRQVGEDIEVGAQGDWLHNLNLSNPDIANFLLSRVDSKSFEFTRNHLYDFALLSHEMQNCVVKGGYTDEHGNVVAPLEPEETQLLSYLRVPLTLRTAMSDYLIENGDITEERIAELTPLIEAERLSRSQTRGFTKGEVTYVRVQRMLNKLEESGDLSMREFAFIEKSVGDLYHAIPQVIDLRIAREGRLVAEANADAAEARAEETTAERLAAEARADTAEERTILLALLADSAGRAAESGARAVESGTEAVETIIN